MRIALTLLVVAFASIACPIHKISCENGWTIFSTFCYKIFEKVGNHSQSQAACVREGAHLASVHSAEEEAFIEGLYGCDDYKYLRIGVFSTVEGQWMNEDGTPVNFTDFEPNGKFEGPGYVAIHKEGCAAIGGDKGYWRSDEAKYNDTFLCKKSADSMTHLTSEV